ncbi:MAG: PKD domain-containing protein [Salinivirgaceae bacterium]|nr:PKD domain-containing protein [Salinivirgaceae bacterium]
MKKLILGIFFGLPMLFFGQTVNNNSVSKNMQDIKWGTESHVIPCASFGVTQPLRDIIRDRSTVKSKPKKTKQAPDKRDMPVQNFIYNAKEHGEKYGNDYSIIQKEYGRNIGYENNKAIELSWEGQAPSVNFRPFDPTGAAGPNHYIQMINGDTYEIWNKTGTSLGGGNISALWASGKGDGDPIVLYDNDADRWFMSQFGGSGDNGIYIAISQTADPLGAWYTYEFLSPDFPDYLKFSAWQDGYYMTGNYNQKIFAFNRDKMLAGDASAEAVYQTFNPPASGFFVPLPADASDGVMPGTNTPCPIFAYADDAWGSSAIDVINIYNASVTWTGTPIMNVTTAANLNTAAFDASYDNNWDDISQPGVSQKLDGIGGAMMFRAQWKTWSGYNTVLLNWAVQVSASQRGIFWCELRQDQTTDNWSIYQQGIYAPSTDSYWMGSIAMNDNGDIGLAYAKASTSTYMSLAYAGRLASDPLGTLPIAEVIAMAGTGAQTGMNRVGDYAQTCLDPDGETFWHTGEYLSNGGTAKTQIYSFKFSPPCTAPTNQATNYSASAIEDNQMTVNWTRGNGDRVVVLAHEGSIVNTNPGTGVSYTDNAVFGSGDQIAEGNYVVYDGTGTNVTVTELEMGTTYHYSVFEYATADNCYLTPALTGDATTTGTAPCEICDDVTSTSDDATGVTLFSFNTISNTSTGDPAYTDNTATSTTVNQGASYNISVNVNTGGSFTVYTKVWIDWNQNCDFSDAGEEYDLGSANSVTNGATSLSPLSITVPAGALSGNTVLRVRATYSSAPTPCGNQSYSEAEDYTINITGSDFSGTPTTICEGGTVTFTDASLNSPTSWTWTFGDSGTATTQNPTHTYTTAGIYTVTLTATNGEDSDLITKENYITVIAPPNAGTNGTLTICEGTTPTDNELFAELGGNPDTGGTWSNSGLVYTYTVNATTPCTGNATATVNVTLDPLAQVSFDIDASGEPIINFTNTSTDADSYSWDLGDGTTETTTNVAHEYASNNTFTVILSATNPCGTVTSQQNVTITTIGITSLNNSTIKIFPNPTETILNVKLPVKNTAIQLVSLDGIVLRSITAGKSQDISINVENLSSGVYNLVITTESKEQVIVKVVKK